MAVHQPGSRSWVKALKGHQPTAVDGDVGIPLGGQLHDRVIDTRIKPGTRAYRVAMERNAAPSPTLTVTNALMVSTATVGAGTAPFTINWGDGSALDTGLAAGAHNHTYIVAGTHTVTVTDAQLWQATAEAVSAVTAPTITLANTALVVTATIGAGTEPYTVEWGDGQKTEGLTAGDHDHTFTAAGTYTVTVTDKGGQVATASTGPITVVVAKEGEAPEADGDSN